MSIVFIRNYFYSENSFLYLMFCINNIYIHMYTERISRKKNYIPIPLQQAYIIWPFIKYASEKNKCSNKIDFLIIPCYIPLHGIISEDN